jgi:hypothetical protein
LRLQLEDLEKPSPEVPTPHSAFDSKVIKVWPEDKKNEIGKVTSVADVSMASTTASVDPLSNVGSKAFNL